MAYMKADEWVGRSLTLQVGRGDVTIHDGVKYRDTRLHRYVGMGFLKLVGDEDKAPTVSIPNEKLPVAPEKPAVTRATPPVAPVAPVDHVVLPTFVKEEEGPAVAQESTVAPEAKEDAPKVDAVAVPEVAPESRSEGVITKSPMSKVSSGARRTSTKKDLESDKG